MGYFLLPAIIFVPTDMGKKRSVDFCSVFNMCFMSEVLNVNGHFGCEREIAIIYSYDLILKKLFIVKMQKYNYSQFWHALCYC